MKTKSIQGVATRAAVVIGWLALAAATTVQAQEFRFNIGMVLDPKHPVSVGAEVGSSFRYFPRASSARSARCGRTCRRV